MRFFFALLLTATLPIAARADDLATVRHDWARVYYQMPEAARMAEFPALVARADTLVAAEPAAAEPLILKAIILSTYAEAKGGLGALPLVEDARDAALEAAKRDDRADDAGAYTALGVLYYKVPGWPIGFGNDRKAREYLQQALAIAPNAIDANFFYGDFLREQGDDAEARVFLEKALQAPARPGRADEDTGRRAEIEKALARLEE